MSSTFILNKVFTRQNPRHDKKTIIVLKRCDKIRYIIYIFINKTTKH